MKSIIKNVLAINSFYLTLTIILFAGCEQQQDHSKDLKPIVERGVEVWNTGNLDAVDELWAPNVLRSANQLPEVEGIDGYKEVINSFRTAYPDAKLKIHEEVYSENKVILRWTFTGTNTGEGEMPPTGKRIEIWGISILHFDNGKITREYVSFDNLPLMEQLGYTMIPPSEKTN